MRELSPVFKCPSIADSRDDRRRCQRAYPFHHPEALAAFMVAKSELDLPVGGLDLLLQLCELFVKALEELTAKACELVFGIFQNGRQSAAQLPTCCGSTIPYSPASLGSDSQAGSGRRPSGCARDAGTADPAVRLTSEEHNAC
jgi:hypothetical protein